MSNKSINRRYLEVCFKYLDDDISQGLRQISFKYPTKNPKILLNGETENLDEQLQLFHDRLSQKQNKMRSNTFRALKRLHECDIDFLLIKGMTLESYYPPNLRRKSNDFDLLVRDRDDFWKLCSALSSLGYIPYGIYLSSDKSDFGFAKFSSPNDDEQTEFEVSFGGFSECGIIRGIPSNWLWKQSKLTNTHGFQYREPNTVAHFAILLTELYRKRIHMRDALDYLLLVGQMSEKEKEMCSNVVLELCLQHLLSRVNGLIKRYFPSQVYDRVLMLEDCKPARIIKTGWLIRRNISHLFSNLRKDRNRIESLKITMFNLADEVWNEIAEKGWFKLVRARRIWQSVSKRRKQGQPILLMYLEGLNHHNLEWFYAEDNQFLLTPIGCFYLSVDGLETDQEFDLIQQSFVSKYEKEGG